MRLQGPSGAGVTLTRSELVVLKILAIQPNQQATRPQIVEALGCAWESYDERRLETIVSRLKRKLLTECGAADSPIRSLRGQGYVFTEVLQLA